MAQARLAADFSFSEAAAWTGDLTSIYQGMLARCNNPSSNGYHRYGGRGIKVCDRWSESFVNFANDMGPRPSPHYSIDRINNDGNYEPGNCRWATRKTQARNTSRTVFVDVGERLVPLAEVMDFNRNVKRVNRLVAPSEPVVFPIRQKRGRPLCIGLTKSRSRVLVSIRELQSEIGRWPSMRTVANRLNIGVASVSKAMQALIREGYIVDVDGERFLSPDLNESPYWDPMVAFDPDDTQHIVGTSG